MIIQDVAPQIVTLTAVVVLLMIVFTMIVGEDLPTGTIVINISLARMKNLDQEGNMMTIMIVEKKGAKTGRGILWTKAESRRRAMSPGQPETTIEIQTVLRVTRMKETVNAGGVEARIGVKERGREKEAEIQAGTRIKRKNTDAATAMMMTGAIGKKTIRSLKEAEMTKVEESGSARKIQTEMAAESARNGAGMTRIRVVVTLLALMIVRKNDRREMKEEAMAEVVIGIGLHRHQEGSTTSMEILWWQIEIEQVKEIEINAMNRVMGDLDLALRTGDLETETQGMDLIGDPLWEETVIQMIDAGTMIEEDNTSSEEHTLIRFINNTRFYTLHVKLRVILHQDEFELSSGCFGSNAALSRYQINKLSYLLLLILNVFLVRYSIA